LFAFLVAACCLVLFALLPPPTTSTLFPYTTLFRSHPGAVAVGVLVCSPGVVEGAGGVWGEQVGVLSGAGPDRRADGPGRLQRAGGGGVVAGGGVVGGGAAGVDQPRGLLGVVVPAQAVEVPQAGTAASAGGSVAVLADVVVLGGEQGGARAA